jgi:predicted phage baseplate assembly protein
VRIPEVQLDDRRFQQLVTEARERVAAACPEWTDHNVSDPGITLIELFAWMTDMLVYRINRVPEKLHARLLELLDIRLQPPAPAETDVRFRLAAPAAEPVPIPAVETEIATERTVGRTATVFQVAETFTIPALRPSAYLVERGGAFKEIAMGAGWARPNGRDQLPFASPPRAGDALYLGFDQPPGRLVLQVYVDCTPARGTGIDPDAPPLVWEVSSAQRGWTAVEVLHDSTGGFNRGSGVVEVQVPAATAPAPIAGHEAHWLRCRVVTAAGPGPDDAGYQQPPSIFAITAAPVGALLRAHHAMTEGPELLGSSDGTPGQSFHVRNAPMLYPGAGERLQVQDVTTGEWADWDLRETFAESGPADPHYVLDLATGEVELGPAIRGVNGDWRLHGAVPEPGAPLRFTGYRHGGGDVGNVAADTLRVLRTAIPGVASVTNPRPARGGLDAESLENGRRRAALEFRTRQRAVTASDYEFLCGQASSDVARARCVAAERPGDSVRVHILPRIDAPDRYLPPEELRPNAALMELVRRFLDDRRPVGTSVDLLPVPVRHVTVVASVAPAGGADIVRLEQDVLYALDVYLNPIIGGSLSGWGAGWEFGRVLNQGELYGLVHTISGVAAVNFVRMYDTDAETGKPHSSEIGSHLPIGPSEVIASGRHRVLVDRTPR